MKLIKIEHKINPNIENITNILIYIKKMDIRKYFLSGFFNHEV